MTTIKRKRTGWTYPENTVKDKKKNIINDCLDPQPYWDDWNEHRDGMRGYGDKTKLNDVPLRCNNKHDPEVIKHNKRIKKKLLIRRIKKLFNRVKHKPT